MLKSSPDRAQTVDDSFALAGSSAAVTRLRQHLERIAPYYRCALLLGERGSGKEMTARRLHALSPAAQGPFVVCTAAGLAQDGAAVDAAQRGTLFVDDVGSLSLPLQDELMRRLAVLQRKMRARIAETRLVTASHTDLRSLSASGNFRQDLYGRIAVVELQVVPLRQRAEDIEALVGLCLKQIAPGGRPAMLAPEAIERLQQHAWPGNLRELRDVIEQAAAATEGAVIEPHHLPKLSGAAPALAETPEEVTVERLDDVVRRHVTQVLSRCAGNKFRAAELLGISRSTLYRMLDV
jgi:two-component system response regulator HydG